MDQVLARLQQATAHLDPPYAVVDLESLRANAVDLARRADGVPIRIASKSVRCRAVVTDTLAREGFAGIMAYSLREAIWLADHGATDILLGYPTADAGALAQLDEERAGRIVLMVDSPGHLDLIREHSPVRLGSASTSTRRCGSGRSTSASAAPRCTRSTRPAQPRRPSGPIPPSRWWV